jgi:adenylate cyclase
LGPLGLELALRAPGQTLAFEEGALAAGTTPDFAAALWRALGFPDPVAAGERFTPAQVNTLRVLAGMAELLGKDELLRLARVVGGAVAQIADAIVDAFRVKVELPRLGAGEQFSDLVADYVSIAATAVPALSEVIGDILRAHIVRASRASWTPDEERATVTRERTIGFVDLVGYTSAARALSPAALADEITRFESRVGDVVARHGGRVVKLIGDEAMFVIDDALDGAPLALELIRALADDPQLPPVRVGLAAGPVVTLYGDYYGDIVNLAARLVKVADPGEALVSESVADQVRGELDVERVEVPPLKGFEQAVPAYRIRP